MKTKLFSLLASVLVISTTITAAAEAPKVGDAAPGFTLSTLDGKAVVLKDLTKEQPVVLVVLRGWPGYQCPICTRQVHDFVQRSGDFAGKARVVMVYPGPADNLKAHAEEFLSDGQWPKEFLFVTDPDYVFTEAYGLRWDAKRETAYPSTFITDTKGTIRFAKVSKSHGGRSSAAEVIEALDGLKQK